jgi:hypothetical protein
MTETDEREERENEPRVILLPSRRRWQWKRWALPLCVLIAVSSGLVMRMSLDDWRGLTALSSKPVSPRAVVRPSVARIERLDPVPAPPLPRPEAAALRPSAVGAASLGARPSMPTLIPPPARHEAAASLASREIAEESLRQQAEQERIAIFQEHQPEIERNRRRALRLQRIQQAIAEAETERLAFHAAVVAILDTHGSRAGAKLMDLLEQYDSTTAPEVADAWRIVSEQRSTSSLSAKKIHLYRSLGMPEPAILDDLMRSECKRIPARNGPRNAADAMVRAAKKLRAMPPGRRQAAAEATGQPVANMPQ